MKILIQCGDHFENQNRISILVNSLLNRGQTPIILMYKKGGGNLFKIKGVQVTYLSDYIKKSELDVNFSSKIYDNLTVMDFIKIEIARNPKLGWPSQIKKTSNSALSHLNAISKILDDIKPDRVVIWNGFTGLVANTLRVLCKYQNIPSSFLERGLLKNSLFIDNLGVNGASSLTSNADFFMKEFNDELSSYVDSLFFTSQTSETFMMERPNFLIGKKLIFFPLQVQLDTNIVLYCPYNTMREVFFEIYQNLNEKNTFFIVRPHPEEAPETLKNIPKLDNVMVSTDESLDYWLNLSDLVVTINSTVGLEALIKGKPTICLGKSIYSSLPCLSNYQTMIDNKSIILSTTKDYLIYLVTHNLLVKDSHYNDLIVTNIFEIKDNFIEYPFYDKIEVFGSKIFCDFTFTSQLNLTYRKNAEPITLAWIDEIFRPLLGRYTFVQHINEAEIVITDKKFEDINFLPCKSYFDTYGICLKSFGGEM